MRDADIGPAVLQPTLLLLLMMPKSACSVSLIGCVPPYTGMKCCHSACRVGDVFMPVADISVLVQCLHIASAFAKLAVALHIRCVQSCTVSDVQVHDD